MYPFERFNDDAKRTLQLAQEEAERSHHSYIGTEHLLLGLLRVESGTAFRVLTSLGIAIDPVREMIKTVLGRNERIIVQQIIPTSRVKLVIEMSFEEARRMGHNQVDTGHLLMGLLLEGEGIAAHVLTDLGATRERVIPAVETELGVPISARPKMRRRRRHQPEPTSSAGRIDTAPIHSSAATDLARLLQAPAIAKLLGSRGVDTQALLTQLTKPPPNLLVLRHQLAITDYALNKAITSQDYERAAKLRDELIAMTKKVDKAEEEWLDSLA